MEVAMKQVNPTVLKQQMEINRLSLADLAKKARINKQTLWRLTAGKVSKARDYTIEQIAKALKVDPRVLTGEAVAPDVSRGNEPPTPKDRLNVAICTEARNALHLTALRYNVSQQQILELAPLLFCWAAEASLHQRLDKITQVERAWENVRDLEQRLPHLPDSNFTYAEAIAVERQSIEDQDLFAISIQNGETILDGTFSRFSEMDNPFAMFLGNLVQTIGNVATFEECSWDELPVYRVCSDEAAALVGGDKDRAEDILSGYVSLSEMPKDIRDFAMSKERADWVRAKADEYCKEVFGTTNRPSRFSASSFAQRTADGAST
jgi:transcriptional regulator with XRE-family HTH domain